MFRIIVPLIVPLAASTVLAQGTRQAGFFSFQDDACTAFVINGDAKYAMLGFNSGGVCVFPIDQMTVHVISFPAHKKAITGAVFIPESKSMATASADGAVKVWKVDDARKHHKTMEDSNGRGKAPAPLATVTIAAHKTGVTGVSLHPGGKRLASSGLDGAVKIWDVDSGKSVAILADAHAGGTRTVAYSPDGKLLASGGADRAVKIWDVQNDKPTLKSTLEGHDGVVTSVAFDPKGVRIAAGCGVLKKSGAIFIWDVATAKYAFKLTGPDDIVTCVLFHPTTPHLASGGADKKIRFWSLTDQKQLSADEHGETISSLNISFDGLRFGSSSAHTARWWRGFSN